MYGFVFLCFPLRAFFSVTPDRRSLFLGPRDIYVRVIMYIYIRSLYYTCGVIETDTLSLLAFLTSRCTLVLPERNPHRRIRQPGGGPRSTKREKPKTTGRRGELFSEANLKGRQEISFGVKTFRNGNGFKKKKNTITVYLLPVLLILR